MKRVGNNRSRRGFVLVSVLWLAAFAIVLVVALLQQSRATLTVARAGVEESLADAMLTGAVEQVAIKYRGGRSDGHRSTLTVPGGTVVVAVEDVNGLIDINSVAPPVIDEIAGDLRARTAGQTIVDRRGGAAGETPQPFRLREEVGALPGAKPDLAAFFSDYGTVFSTDGKINPMTAPLAVLASLPGIEPDVARQAVALRRRPQGTPQQVMKLLAPAADFLDPTPGKAIDVYLEARVGTKAGRSLTKTLRVTIVFAGGGKSPYRIADWRPWAAEPAWVGAADGVQG
jgi:type II secretory pathway component PulK